MKKLNKHPRLFKKTALTLKKLITGRVKLMRNKQISNSTALNSKNNVNFYFINFRSSKLV